MMQMRSDHPTFKRFRSFPSSTHELASRLASGLRDCLTRMPRQSFQTFVAAGLSVAGVLLSMSVGATAKANIPQTILVYGDSLSAAYGIKPEQGWVALLAQKLAADAKTRAVRVVNASVSGETTSGGRARVRADLAQHKPTIVIVALGANDGLRGLPVSDTRANLAAMLDAIRDSKARAVLVGIQIPPNYGIEYARDFRDLYPALARERKLALVPFLLEGVADKLELFQADRLHPVAAAQPLILQNVWTTLGPLLGVTKVAPPNRKPS
jgi:acyl-CoA thioesterase-1